MNRYYLLFLLFPGFFLLSCRKTEVPVYPVDNTKVVIVHTTVSGRVQYPLFSQPLRGAKVLANARKMVYYTDRYGPVYKNFVLDSTYTDSNGNFSMTFDRDSLDCVYYLTCAQGAPDSMPRFPAGDSSWLSLDLYKSVHVPLSLDVRHNDSSFLYIYFNDTSSFQEVVWGSDLLPESMYFSKSKTVYLYFKCDKAHVLSYHTTVFPSVPMLIRLPVILL